MELWLDALVVALILSNLKLLGSSRLSACIRVVAGQGVLLALLQVFLGGAGLAPRVMVLALLTALIKGLAFPWLLLRALRAVNARRETEPLVGYTTSLLLGVALLALAMWLGGRLPLPVPVRSPLVVPLALFTIMTGLLAVISRRKALTQVLGYLVMENGIYAFGLAFARHEPLLLELGILLDVFMAVFVMGITLFHINREFDHLDADRLSALKD